MLTFVFCSHLCRPCHNREKARGLGKYICQKCHAIIEEQPLIFKNDPYHPDHFNCSNCGSVEQRCACLLPLYWRAVIELVCFTVKSWPLMPASWKGSSTVCPAMIRWVCRSVEPADGQSRAEWSMPWANSGTWRLVRLTWSSSNSVE